MPKANTRFKLDAMIKENAALLAIANTSGDPNHAGRKAAIKNLSSNEASKEMLERIIKRVERI